MKLVTVMFDYGGNNAYHRLYNVFRASCLANMPDVKFEPHLIDAPQIKAEWTAGANANVAKLRVWKKVIDESDETVCFSDCDMFALRSVADADEMDFDLAYTTRRFTRMPINGGVVFVKPTPGGRALMAKWNEIDDRMFEDHVLHQKWREKYAGMNQAAFGYLLEKHSNLGKMIPIPCAKWNSCYDTWDEIDGKTRMVHIKGQLRRNLLDGDDKRHFPTCLIPVIEKWRAFEEELGGPGLPPPNAPKREVRTAVAANQVFRRKRTRWA